MSWIRQVRYVSLSSLVVDFTGASTIPALYQLPTLSTKENQNVYIRPQPARIGKRTPNWTTPNHASRVNNNNQRFFKWRSMVHTSLIHH
jgi:hypothetical protein